MIDIPIAECAEVLWRVLLEELVKLSPASDAVGTAVAVPSSLVEDDV